MHILAAALALHITNFSGAPPSEIQQARGEVTRVYASIGVPLEWDAADTDPRLGIRVVLLPYETGDLRRHENAVMGAALRTADGNAIAYVFYHRVQAEAQRYQVSTGRVLACAIAHELGHLLLPEREHAATGLMRASWSRTEFRRADQGQLTFLPSEVASILNGVR